MSRIVGLLHYPWGEDYGVGRLRPRRPRRLYRSMVAYKANPRDPDYMRRLFDERHPDGELVRTDEDGWEGRLGEVSRVVVLYPDATGLGFARLERELRRDSPGRELEVLNGRRRSFALDPATRRRLRVRRALERSMLIEAVGVVLLSLATPVLLVADLVRGRR